MALLFAGDLNPVAPKAQRKVQLPDGLDLDAWINAPPEESDSDDGSADENSNEHLFVSASDRNGADGGGRHQQQQPRQPDPTDEELQQMRRARQLEQSYNPNYLKSSGGGGGGGGSSTAADNGSRNAMQYNADFGCEDIPIAELAIDVPLNVSCKYLVCTCVILGQYYKLFLLCSGHQTLGQISAAAKSRSCNSRPTAQKDHVIEEARKEGQKVQTPHGRHG